MRLKWIGLILVGAAVAIAACSAPRAKEFGKADQEAIRKLVQDFGADYNAKDVAKVATHFSGDAVLMPANRSTLRGIDLVKTYYEERFQAGATDLTIEAQDVSGNGPLGYVTATFSLKVVPPAGGETTSDRGKVLWIVRNLAGQWRFEYQIMSSDLPPVVPAPPATDVKKGEKK